ncbi:MAG: BamA/TamA family outer membrane protein [Saprospiraceae bacterium]|nr:BamA/TamA family outer membrane protein [Saprospiraceae bacterium]
MASAQGLISQKKIYVGIKYFQSSFTSGEEEIYYKSMDSIEVPFYLSNRINELLSQGYSVPNLDTIVFKNDTCIAYIYKGNKYTIGGINFSQEQTSILESSGIRRSKLAGKALEAKYLEKFLNSLVDHQTNYGYPFAKAKFDSIRFDNNKLYAGLKIDRGRLFTFDTIVMEGKIHLSKRFLERFLDIFPTSYYAHDKVVSASRRLNDLQYAKQSNDPVIRFVNDKASLVLTLDPKPASRFDFLIGVLPQIKDGVRKWTISGDFTAELNNSFNQGEYIYLQVKRLKAENLELQMKSTLPYIAGLPVGSHIDFRIFKNASQNIDLFFDGGFQYLFGGFNNIKIYGSYRSSRLLEINSDQITASARLPQNLDVSYSGGGIGLSIRKLDYRFNPSKGYALEINTIVGSKKIIKNINILQLEGFENSYDSLKLNTLQADIEASCAFYKPVKNWATIKMGGNAGVRLNQQQIRTNEQFRIGGNKLLRGFDEESIMTDRYAFGTVEFRFLFDQNSYLSLPFIDFGVTRVIKNGVPITDTVLGIGMGLNFGTTAGIFNLSFAAGRNLGNPFDFGKMKIHFGYVNLF